MLNDTRIRNARPGERDYKLTDFDGLYLLVCKTGSRWGEVQGMRRRSRCDDGNIQPTG